MTKLLRHGIAVALVGCGGTGSTPDASGSADGSHDPKKTGAVLIFEETIAQVSLTSEGAFFTDAAATTGVRVDGPCTIRTVAGGSGSNVSAGNITITRATDVVTLVPDTAGKYAGVEQQNSHYAGGDVLAIHADGAAVPTFAGDFTFPRPITVATPPPLSKSGYTVSWAGAGPVRILIGQQSNVAIGCDYTGNSATIPASTLSDLIPGTGSAMQISISIGSFARKELEPGGFGVELQAYNIDYATVGFVQ